jgi:hypothetical protein
MKTGADNQQSAKALSNCIVVGNDQYSLIIISLCAIEALHIEQEWCNP